MSEEQQSHEDESAYQQQRDPFTREDLNNADRLRNTNFKHPLHLMIDKSTLYESAKRALHLIVDDFFADNRFLTNLTSSAHGKDHVLGTNLDLERSLIFATASFCPTDIKNPDLTNIRNALINHNRPITLRAVGADRERRVNMKSTSSIEQTISRNDNIQTQPVQPQKKGWLSFLGGK